jgi:hypothetical protein
MLKLTYWKNDYCSQLQFMTVTDRNANASATNQVILDIE